MKITGTASVEVSSAGSGQHKSLSIPDTVSSGGKTYQVTSIAKNAFANSTSLTSVTIGNKVKTIGDGAFAGCKNLKKVTIGEKTAKIGKNAFKNCKKLATITIRSTSLSKVGKNAFKGIKATAKIKVPKKKLAAYKKLLKNKGQGKKVKIVKK